MKKTCYLKPLAAIPLLVLTGCAGIGSITGNDKLAVQSTPSDATVYVMDQAVGQTPLELTQQSLYPNTYPQDKADLYGVITLKKAGCQDYVKRISSRDIATGVQAQLDCGENRAAANAASTRPAAAPAPIPEPAVTNTPETPAASTPTPAERSARQRLQRIDQLKDEGLITEQEYRAVRQRILDSL